MKFDTKIDKALEKIKIKDFVDEYNNKVGEKFKESYLKDTIKITPYLSFTTKTTFAKSIVWATTFRYVDDMDKETGEVRMDEKTGKPKRIKTDDLEFNTPAQALFFTRCVIENYTNLVGGDEFYKDYDLLVSSGALKDILVLIPESELTEFKSIVDMTLKDLLDNYSNQNSYIYKQLQQKKVEAFSKGFVDSFKKTLQKNMDTETLNEILGLFGGSDSGMVS